MNDLHISQSWQHFHPHRQGTALITVSVMILVLAALTIAMTDLSVAGLRSQIDRVNNVELMASAESGLNAVKAGILLNYELLVDDDTTTNLALDSIGDVWNSSTLPLVGPALNLNNWAAGGYNPGYINGVNVSANVTRIGVSPDNVLAENHDNPED